MYIIYIELAIPMHLYIIYIMDVKKIPNGITISGIGPETKIWIFEIERETDFPVNVISEKRQLTRPLHFTWQNLDTFLFKKKAGIGTWISCTFLVTYFGTECLNAYIFIYTYICMYIVIDTSDFCKQIVTFKDFSQ